MEGFQKKYLRGLAHGLDPVVLIGQKGATDALVKSVNEQLDIHELIKAKFTETKEKDAKEATLKEIVARTGCDVAGTVGHVAILYRMHRDPEKRKIQLPKKKA